MRSVILWCLAWGREGESVTLSSRCADMRRVPPQGGTSAFRAGFARERGMK